MTDGGDCGGVKRDSCTSIEAGQARCALSYGDGGTGQDSSSVVRGSKAPGTKEAMIYSSTYRGGEGGESASRPAVPVPPPSSAPSSGRRFRRPSAAE